MNFFISKYDVWRSFMTSLTPEELRKRNYELLERLGRERARLDPIHEVYGAGPDGTPPTQDPPKREELGEQTLGKGIKKGGKIEISADGKSATQELDSSKLKMKSNPKITLTHKTDSLLEVSKKGKQIATFTEKGEDVYLTLDKKYIEEYNGLNPDSPILPNKDGSYTYKVKKLKLSKNMTLDDLEVSSDTTDFKINFSSLGCRLSKGEGEDKKEGFLKNTDGIPFDFQISQKLLERFYGDPKDKTCVFDEKDPAKSMLLIAEAHLQRQGKQGIVETTIGSGKNQITLKSYPITWIDKKTGEKHEEVIYTKKENGHVSVYCHTTHEGKKTQRIAGFQKVDEASFEATSVTKGNPKNPILYLGFAKSGGSVDALEIPFDMADEKTRTSLVELNKDISGAFDKIERRAKKEGLKPWQVELAPDCNVNFQKHTARASTTLISLEDAAIYSLNEKFPKKEKDDDITDPGPTDPGPTDPGPTDPGPTDPGPTDPGPTDPGPTDPGPTDPGPTDPGPTDPGPTDPGPTDPGPTDPGPTDPGPDLVDPGPTPQPTDPDGPGTQPGPTNPEPQPPTPDGQAPDGQNPDGQNPDGQNPDGQNPPDQPTDQGPQGENPQPDEQTEQAPEKEKFRFNIKKLTKPIKSYLIGAMTLTIVLSALVPGLPLIAAILAGLLIIDTFADLGVISTLLNKGLEAIDKIKQPKKIKEKTLEKTLNKTLEKQKALNKENRKIRAQIEEIEKSNLSPEEKQKKIAKLKEKLDKNEKQLHELFNDKEGQKRREQIAKNKALIAEIEKRDDMSKHEKRKTIKALQKQIDKDMDYLYSRFSVETISAYAKTNPEGARIMCEAYLEQGQDLHLDIIEKLETEKAHLEEKKENLEQKRNEEKSTQTVLGLLVEQGSSEELKESEKDFLSSIAHKNENELTPEELEMLKKLKGKFGIGLLARLRARYGECSTTIEEQERYVRETEAYIESESQKTNPDGSQVLTDEQITELQERVEKANQTIASIRQEQAQVAADLSSLNQIPLDPSQMRPEDIATIDKLFDDAHGRSEFLRAEISGSTETSTQLNTEIEQAEASLRETDQRIQAENEFDRTIREAQDSIRSQAGVLESVEIPDETTSTSTQTEETAETDQRRHRGRRSRSHGDEGMGL